MKITIIALLFLSISCSTNNHKYFKNAYIPKKYEKKIDQIIISQIHSCLRKEDAMKLIKVLKVSKNTHHLMYSKKIDKIIIKRSYILKNDSIIQLEDFPPFFIKKNKGQLTFIINNESLKNVVAQWIQVYSDNYSKLETSCNYMHSSIFNNLVDDIDLYPSHEIKITE